MQNKLQNQIKQLREEIEKENNEDFDRVMTDILFCDDPELKSDNEENDDSDAEDSHNAKMLALLCLVVDAEFQLLEAGVKAGTENLRDDLNSILEYVQKCELCWKVSKEIVSDTIDLLLCLSDVEEKVLRKYMPEYVFRFIREHHEISEGMYVLFMQVADAFKELGEKETAYHLIEELCFLSRKRNGNEMHQELVVNVFVRIGMDAPETIYRIAEQDERRFERLQTEYTGDFYWFYASVLWQMQEKERAERAFEKCYVVRKALYGENDWYTARAGREKSFIDCVMLQKPGAENYLQEFVHKAQSCEYDRMEEQAVVDFILGQTICVLLMRQFGEMPDIAEYKWLLDIYEGIRREYPEMRDACISERLAWNFRGNYYVQRGEYILAEDAFRNALSSEKKDGSEEILSDEQIKSNLLTMYTVQNDAGKANEMLEKFGDESLKWKDKANIMASEDQLRIYCLKISTCIQSGAGMEEKELRKIKEFAGIICEAILTRKDLIAGSQVMAAMFIYIAAVFMMENECADNEDLQLYLNALSYAERDTKTYKFLKQQRHTIVHGEALLAWNLGLPKTETEKYINRYLDGIEESRIEELRKAGMYETAVFFFGKNKQYQTALAYMEKALDSLTATWHKYVKYANDSRLLNSLEPAQKIFGGCYAFLRTCIATEDAYERLLQFKMLASLAGRERNRIIHESSVDSAVIKKINELQDQLAVLATESIFRVHDVEHEELETELRRYETEFAADFPERAKFKDVTWNLVQEAIPDHSVILEYFFCADGYGYTMFEEQSDEAIVLDLYMIRKVNGRAEIRRHTIKDGLNVVRKAEQFVKILQEKSENSGTSKNEEDLEELRCELYHLLIEPAMTEIGEISTVYFAPDFMLVNLPFELLYEDESLEESHQIVKIECARDFLFSSSDEPQSSGSLVIGNPEYEVKEQEISYEEEISPEEEKDADQGRAMELDLTEIEQLPFSEIEAQQVAYRLGTIPWIGKAATKEKVLEAQGYRNLHIATHGSFDLSGETKAIFSSCLFFAGVKNWSVGSMNLNGYGNGIVTADEISRLNLRGMKLVVLSSCLNGRSEWNMNKGFQGMIGAFAAAGADYVIAHLWSAPDTIGTVILMDSFYYYYTEEQLEPPLALARAKEYLKTLSIRKMREQGWFTYVRNSTLDAASKESVAAMEKCDDRLRPYRNEIFWGGFSCYRCN